ncbi:MAG: hypothetical protein PUB22_05025 [Clostridiales bacterium]|nr:hypothetical protein [Clostridiales bacterium]
MNNKENIFRVGDFCFCLSYPEEIIPPDNFMLFEVKSGIPTYHYTLSFADRIPELDKPVIARREDIVIYSDRGLESRKIGTKGRRDYYALYQEKEDRSAEIQLAKDQLQDMCFDTVFTSLFALERHMILRDSLILHCAYIQYQGKGILFSAPSGVGKSTQAGLWEQFRGSKTLNGDRALLRKIDGVWSACGWPVCGSSDICELGDTPIHGIVMLRQGTVNHITALTPIQAFSELYAQITINQWNRGFVQRAMERIEDLIMQVPVYQLTCDMTEDAVRCLESVLFPREFSGAAMQ